MRRTLFELIVIVIVIARMTRNDPPNKHESCRMVNSRSSGSRFGTAVRLGHNQGVCHCYMEWPFYTGRGLGKFGQRLRKKLQPLPSCAWKKIQHVLYIPKFNCIIFLKNVCQWGHDKNLTPLSESENIYPPSRWSMWWKNGNGWIQGFLLNGWSKRSKNNKKGVNLIEHEGENLHEMLQKSIK